MKPALFSILLSTVVVAACIGDSPLQVDDTLDPALAKSGQRALCRPTILASGPNAGTVSRDDCVFPGAAGDQYEDLFLVAQGHLGSGKGNLMATFALEAEGFDWIFGLGGNTKEIFPTPVYAFRDGPAGVYQAENGFTINTFSVIGGEPIYKMWVGGQNTDAIGAYTLTATAEPASDTCARGHRVYLQGDLTFGTWISNDNSCRGTVEFGPNVGAPLNYQYWWIRVSAGDVITLNLYGISNETVAAAIIDFDLDQISLDLGDGPGDSDRSVTFTAQRRGDMYVEVSSAPDVFAGYSVTLDGPGTR